MNAIEWLIDNGLAENQGDIAVKAGLGPNLISRIKNGHVKAVSDDAIRALCSAFKELNIDYLRGKSDIISHFEDYNCRSSIDDCLRYEKSVQKIYDDVAGKYIANLEHQVERLEKDMDVKNETIRILQARIRELEARVASPDNYIFPVGVADKDSHTAETHV